jgi:endonuclease/exonuclease/phosphatase family metal-dependent hydrolase
VRLRAASYNVHGFVGGDGRFDPARVATVIAGLSADVVGLQEVVFEGPSGCPHDGLPLQLPQLPYRAAAVTREHGASSVFGNALLSRYPITRSERIVLDHPRREPRTALDCDVRLGPCELRVLVAHLGLRAAERARQAEQLLSMALRGEQRPCLLMGDFNEWFMLGRARRTLERFFESSHAQRSYPARYALFSLDRIWVKPRQALVSFSVSADPVAKIASDHLPVVADVALDVPDFAARGPQAELGTHAANGSPQDGSWRRRRS